MTVFQSRKLFELENFLAPVFPDFISFSLDFLMKVLNQNSFLPYVILLILCILIYSSIPSHNATQATVHPELQKHESHDISKSLVHEQSTKVSLKGSTKPLIHEPRPDTKPVLEAKNSSVPKLSRIDPLAIKDDSGKTWVDRVYMINRIARFDRLQVCLTMLNSVGIYPQVFDAIEPEHDPVKGIFKPYSQAAIIPTRLS